MFTYSFSHLPSLSPPSLPPSPLQFPEAGSTEADKEMYVRRLQTKKERQKELRDKHALIKKERLTKFQVRREGGREGGRGCLSECRFISYQPPHSLTPPSLPPSLLPPGLQPLHQEPGRVPGRRVAPHQLRQVRDHHLRPRHARSGTFPPSLPPSLPPALSWLHTDPSLPPPLPPSSSDHWRLQGLRLCLLLHPGRSLGGHPKDEQQNVHGQARLRRPVPSRLPTPRDARRLLPAAAAAARHDPAYAERSFLPPPGRDGVAAAAARLPLHEPLWPADARPRWHAPSARHAPQPWYVLPSLPPSLPSFQSSALFS